jgi:hypothetical protein
MMGKLSGARGVLRACAVLAVLFVPTIASSRGPDGLVVVQRIGDISGDTAAEIAKRVRIVPFSTHFDPRTTPILLRGAWLFLQEDGAVGGLDPGQADAIRDAYGAGQPIAILDASTHDVDALHRLIGAGAIYESSTHPLVQAYVLRKENHVPTARVLTYAHLSPRVVLNPEHDTRAATRAVDIVVSELEHPPAPGGSGPIGDGPVDWTGNPTQTHILTVNSSSGAFTTTVHVYALHSCTTNDDHYVVTALADWTATEAKFQSVGKLDGSMHLDISNTNVVLDWKDTRDHCDGQAQSYSVCRYVEYPLFYELTMEPPTRAGVLQTNAAPAATQGIATTYTSGFAFSIGGTVNVSAMGPGGGIQAGATWSNTSATTVPALLVDVSNVPTDGQGVQWKFRYCTSGDSSGDCISHVQMAPASGNVCVSSRMGDPQHGQTAEGKFSNAVQTGYWVATKDTRTGDSFDIDVTFTAQLAATDVRLFNGNFEDLHKDFPANPFYGNCNIFNCSCSNSTSESPVKTFFTFKVPFPSTRCQ